jgi:hypothetical protein
MPDPSAPHPSLAETIRFLRAENKLELLPPRLLPYLESLNPKSPHFDTAASRTMTSGAQTLVEQLFREQGGEPGMEMPVSAEQFSDIMHHFAKGLVYASQHFSKSAEGNAIPELDVIGLAPAPRGSPLAYGFSAHEHDSGHMYVGIYPRLITMNVSQDILRKRGQLKGQGRVYTDDKIPGKYFNAREATILTGIEEACHFQQMKKGRMVYEYDPHQEMDDGAYENAECEQEAAALQQQAVVELGLGSNSPDQDPLGQQGPQGPSQPLSPRARADLRKQERKRKKRGRG